MSITLEQVEQLRGKAQVSYEEAKAALAQTGGDLLEALILLERRGKANVGGRDSAFFTTRPGGESPADDPTTLIPPPKAGRKGQTAGEASQPGFGDQVMELLRNLWAIVRHSMKNQFEVWRGDEMTTSMPVLILVILLCVVFWFMIPMLVVGLFFGYRYRFSGPDLNREKADQVMETVTATVNDVVDTVRAELRKVTEDKKD